MRMSCSPARGKHGGAEVSCAPVTSCASPGSRPITHIPSSLDTDDHTIGSAVSPGCHIVAPGRNSDRHVSSPKSRGLNGVSGVARTLGEVPLLSRGCSYWNNANTFTEPSRYRVTEEISPSSLGSNPSQFTLCPGNRSRVTLHR